MSSRNQFSSISSVIKYLRRDLWALSCLSLPGSLCRTLNHWASCQAAPCLIKERIRRPERHLCHWGRGCHTPHFYSTWLHRAVVKARALWYYYKPPYLCFQPRLGITGELGFYLAFLRMCSFPEHNVHSWGYAKKRRAGIWTICAGFGWQEIILSLYKAPFILFY